MRRRPKPPCSPLPPVSIIVAGRNEEPTIAACLNSLLAQEYGGAGTEIIFVDDHSTDGTLRAAQAIARRNPDRLRVLSAPQCPAGRGPKKNALEFGIAHSSGDILLFTDADCSVPPRWAQTIVSYMEGREVGAVTGAMIPVEQTGMTARLLRMERILVSYTTASAIGWGSPASATGGNFAYRRIIYDALGGIAHSDWPSGDDDLMAQAIHRKGFTVAFAAHHNTVVSDLRDLEIARTMQSATRHQSTVQFYPAGWRIAYAFTIFSGLLVLAFLAASTIHPTWLWVLGAVVGIRLLVDAAGTIAFCRTLNIPFATADFLIAELLLPIYSVLRPALAFVRRFHWRGRDHSTKNDLREVAC